MDKAKPVSLSGLILGTFLLRRNVGASFAFDKPIHTSIVVLVSCGALLLAWSHLLPKDGGSRLSRGQQYEALPLSEVGQPHRSREPSPAAEDVRYPSSLRKLRICFFALVCAICTRVAILRFVLVNIQCAGLSWEPVIPLVLAAWDYWTNERHKSNVQNKQVNGSVHHEDEGSYAGQSPFRYIFAGALLSFGSMIGLSAASGSASTFICAATLSNQWLVPFAQRAGTILDLAMLYCIMEVIRDHGGAGGRSPSLRIKSLSWALLIPAAVVLAWGLFYTAFMTNPVQRKRILEIPTFYVWSLTKLDLLACVTLLSACIASLKVGIATVILVTIFVTVCTSTTQNAWNDSTAFPPASTGLGLLSICLMITGFAIYVYFDSASHRESRRTSPLFANGVPIWLWITLGTIILLRTAISVSSVSSVSYHPIDLLLLDAKATHEKNFVQASESKTLAEAVKAYRERYNRHPPPGFEHWYKYATDRDSLIIDDFDSIHRDLLPFWALSPQQIRDRTWEMMSNPWHDASGLSIRNGKVEVSPSKFMMPTHAWMLEGLVRMIGNFAEWVPDMDLAFNVNDECRVAVPFETIEEMRGEGESAASLEGRVENAFSADRASGWTPLPDEPNGERVLREMSWQKTFNEFGNAGCPPESAARAHRQVDLGELCTSCIAPQSMGAFLANWTLANDICHQPDLARLHGIYLAPAAFKATHELYPIFSQSRTSGFNDILYPSAWNYIDKAFYNPTPEFPDPPFAEKNSSLFWRGATSEGFSSGNGQWKGMARQRFVHLANGLNGTDTSSKQALLLPHTTAAGEQKYKYRDVPLSELTRLLPTDVHLVESIARCGGKDCAEQAHELAPLVAPTDFQAHWGYKYLLDLDGAAFSGRFLPFLHSKSLPFKAALFREWWDDRVTAWQHFVPLDVRGQGLWATLAYFTGLEGKVAGREVVLEAHEREAERIAEQGREWAGKVLRKEDMEIYFFRLLLEWGRLTDERREIIGYSA